MSNSSLMDKHLVCVIWEKYWLFAKRKKKIKIEKKIVKKNEKTENRELSF